MLDGKIPNGAQMAGVGIPAALTQTITKSLFSPCEDR
jgi:hypothetical protein